MNFHRLISSRYSVRSYKPDEIEESKLMKVFEAARLAPTANNLQPFQVIVIHTKSHKAELMAIYPREWFVQAPLVLCICGMPAEAWIRKDGKNYLDMDIAIVADHIVLAATELGLGTCFIAAFNEANAREVLSIPAHVQPLLFIPLGYPADEPGIKKRKQIDELVRYEKWE
jgi:nitroreductase